MSEQSTIKAARALLRQMLDDGETALNNIRADLLEPDMDEALCKEIVTGWGLFLRRSMRVCRKVSDVFGHSPDGESGGGET